MFFFTMREFRIRGRRDKIRFRRLRADTRGTSLARLVLLWAAVAFLMFWLARLGR